ncbi:D-alanyl-D-alanine carboxypeptidase [Streptomyces sp. GMY02]|uniref:D-alanyl-D-alanine carboxypeptidase n=1 Tax=Streptomyces sp. GMY02 TaxID=1333528 RepID=UPI0020B8442A|nr:serine hydrolase [Streptomyces sp. GMY02]
MAQAAVPPRSGEQARPGAPAPGGGSGTGTATARAGALSGDGEENRGSVPAPGEAARGGSASAKAVRTDGPGSDGSGRGATATPSKSASAGPAGGPSPSDENVPGGSGPGGSPDPAGSAGTGTARAGVPSAGDAAGRGVPAAGGAVHGGKTAEGGSAATVVLRPGEAGAGSVGGPSSSDGNVRDGSGRDGEEGRGSGSAPGEDAPGDAVRGGASRNDEQERGGAPAPDGEASRGGSASAGTARAGGAESGDAARGGDSASAGAARKPESPEAGDSARGDAPATDKPSGEAAQGGSTASRPSGAQPSGAGAGSAEGGQGAQGGPEAPGSTHGGEDAQEDGQKDAREDAQDGAADGRAEGSRPASAKSAPSDERQGPAWARDGIDQPTAVLTTRPKPDAQPQIDQPTTSLRLPRDPASTFVPLRPESPVPDAERTRQQPMPPLPPLDLLAELTNTPPPPETPVRTVVRRVKIWTPLVLLLLIVFAVVQAVRPLPAPRLALSADPTYTFEGGELDLPWPNEGQGGVVVEGVGTIGMYGEQKPAPIASVAKTMTAYVILKDHPISGDQVGPQITVDKQAGEESNRPDESTAPIEEGEQFTLKQMLQLLMIPSGNNAARLLARWDATTEEAFVKKMNAAAKELGMTDTTYTDPSGLQATTVSTAADQIELGKAVMQNEVFRDIVNTPQIKIPGVEPMIYNNNRILLEPGVSGIKTGSSTPAGGNLLWSANTVVDGKNRRIIGAVMGAQQGTTLDDKLQLSIDNSLKVIKAAQEGVTSAGVVKKGEVVGYVDDGLGGRTPVVATKELRAVGWAGLDVKLKLGAGAGREVPHTAEAGTVIGELTIGTGTGKVSTPVALQRALAEPGFGAKLTRVG